METEILGRGNERGKKDRNRRAMGLVDLGTGGSFTQERGVMVGDGRLRNSVFQLCH